MNLRGGLEIEDISERPIDSPPCSRSDMTESAADEAAMERRYLVEAHPRGDSQSRRCELRILRRDRELRRRRGDASTTRDECHDHVVFERPPHDKRGAQFFPREIGEGERHEDDVVTIQRCLRRPHSALTGRAGREGLAVRRCVEVRLICQPRERAPARGGLCRLMPAYSFGLFIIHECGDVVLDEPGDRRSAPGSVTAQRLMLFRAQLDIELTHSWHRLLLVEIPLGSKGYPAWGGTG